MPRPLRATASQKLQLNDVTICVADTAAPELAARALQRSMERCDFGDAILFSNKPVAGDFRNVRIDRLTSLGDYSAFCLRSMANFIATDFALVIQWDGYVVNPKAWASGFRNYDYIGAPIYRGDAPPVVGNGGFSLRSRKLLDALAKLPPVPGVNEDWVISSVLRKQLEIDYGIRFAPLALAERFSYELKPASRSTFGFHGGFNLWREETDADLMSMFRTVSGAMLNSPPVLWLVESALAHGRRDLAAWLYALLRAEQNSAAIVGKMSDCMPPAVAAATVAALEQHISTLPRRGGNAAAVS